MPLKLQNFVLNAVYLFESGSIRISRPQEIYIDIGERVLNEDKAMRDQYTLSTTTSHKNIICYQKVATKKGTLLVIVVSKIGIQTPVGQDMDPSIQEGEIC